MSRITRADREGAERYTQLVTGTPLDDRGDVELEAFARLSTRELDALVADLVAREAGQPPEPAAFAGTSLRRFLRGELGFATALLACFALIAVLVVGAAALSNGTVTTARPITTSQTGTASHSATTSHTGTAPAARPGTVVDGYSDW